MSRRRALTGLFVLTLALGTATAHASGSSRALPPTQQRGGFGSPSGASSFETVTTTRCQVLEVDAATRTVRVRDAGTDREHVIQLQDRTAIRAKKKSQFDGRKKLQFGDLQVGHELLVTSVIATGEIKQVRVKSTGA